MGGVYAGMPSSYHTQGSGFELPFTAACIPEAKESLQSANAWPAFRSASTDHRGL